MKLKLGKAQTARGEEKSNEDMPLKKSLQKLQIIQNKLNNAQKISRQNSLENCSLISNPKFSFNNNSRAKKVNHQSMVALQ